MKRPFTAGVDDAGRRLETVARRLLPGLPLSSVHKALRNGDIRLNGAKASADARVAEGDIIAVWEALIVPAPTSGGADAEPVPADWVLYLGEDLAVINKPSGLVVHRGAGTSSEPPLDERVRAWLPSSGLSFRPGPLHRIDRETSGIVVFSRTLAGAQSFSRALHDRLVKKIYLTVLSGRLAAPFEAAAPLLRDQSAQVTRTDEEGSHALTVFRPLAWAEGLTLASAEIGTGRTHQIRAHAQLAGHSLAGDRKYGGGPVPGLDVPFLLHAWKLECSLLPPLEAPLPGPRADWLKKIFKFHS